jgi:hypothetical protein
MDIIWVLKRVSSPPAFLHYPIPLPHNYTTQLSFPAAPHTTTHTHLQLTQPSIIPHSAAAPSTVSTPPAPPTAPVVTELGTGSNTHLYISTCRPSDRHCTTQAPGKRRVALLCHAMPCRGKLARGCWRCFCACFCFPFCA